MASITSKPQDDVVSDFIKSSPPGRKSWLWIDGTNFAGAKTDWYSMNSGQKLYFTNFVPGRPLNDTGCIRYYSDVWDAGWYDVPCWELHNVLCQVGVKIE